MVKDRHKARYKDDVRKDPEREESSGASYNPWGRGKSLASFGYPNRNIIRDEVTEKETPPFFRVTQ
jgi:hypothetical protein